MTVRLARAVLAFSVLFMTAASASADVWTPYVNILSITDTTGQTLTIVPDFPSGHPASCGEGIYIVPTSNGSYPSYASIRPLLLAAIENNKMVSFRLDGCSGQKNIVIGLLISL